MMVSEIERVAPPPVEQRTDTLYLELRELIIRGRLGPGVRLSEGETARRFGVSRTPVRDALGRLHAEGFLVPRGSRTRTQLAVADLEPAAMRDLYDTIGTLESTAARTVAAMPRARRDAIADAMDRHTKAFAAELRRRPMNFDALFDTHGRFHVTLVEGCGRAYLQAIVANVRCLVDRYEYAYAPLVGTDHAATLREHAEITAAIRRGDAERAANAARANYTNSANRLEPAIARAMHGTRGTRVAPRETLVPVAP